jgi:hypothetical protein
MSELETRSEPAWVTESLLTSNVAINRLLLSRQETLNSIERSRSALRETLALLVALQYSSRDEGEADQDRAD